MNFCKNFGEVTTRRQISGQRASYFDLLGLAAPSFLNGKLILQRVALDKFDWDDKLPADVIKHWNSWLTSLTVLSDIALDQYSFKNSDNPSCNDKVICQLHGFCDGCLESCIC